MADVMELTGKLVTPDMLEKAMQKPRKRASMSPTQRSIAHLKEHGYRVAIVEKWNPHARIRQDLFGFIDLLAIRGQETLAVQTTSRAHVMERVQKIADSEAVNDVRRAGWRIVVHGWGKLKAGWTLKEVDCS